jgi:hypothetical protein
MTEEKTEHEPDRDEGEDALNDVARTLTGHGAEEPVKTSGGSLNQTRHIGAKRIGFDLFFCLRPAHWYLAIGGRKRLV